MIAHSEGIRVAQSRACDQPVEVSEANTSQIRYLVVTALTVTTAVSLTAASSYQVANGASVDITEHGVCRRVVNNHASGAGIFVPTNTSPEWSSFYNNPPLGVSVSSCSCSVTPGSTTYSTAGSYSFVVPCHNNLTIQVWGGGGGGGGYYNGSAVFGGTGGTSNWDSGSLSATGGTGGRCGFGANTFTYAGGTGGSGSGGTTNQNGGNGGTLNNCNSGSGGGGASGGAGGASRPQSSAIAGNPGTAPGGAGGGGMAWFNAGSPSCNVGNGGGGGGYAIRTYTAATYSVGSNVPVTVGAAGAAGTSSGGSANGGAGAAGRVTITWN